MRKKKVYLKFLPALTIVEMVMALAIMSIVFAVVVPQLRSIRTGWASQRANSEALQNGRVLTEHLSRHLAKAVKISSVSGSAVPAGFIEFLDNGGNTLRYQVGTNNYVQFGQLGGLSDLAGPVNKLQFSCYSLDDFANPTTDVNSIRLVKIETILANSSTLGQDKSFLVQAFVRSNTGTGIDEKDPLEPGVAMKNKIDYGGKHALFDSYNSDSGPYGPKNSSGNAIVAVNAVGESKIVLYNNAIVKGDAYIGPGGNVDKGIKTWSGSQITGLRGTLETVVDIPNLSLPKGLPFNGSAQGNLYLWGNMSQTISADKYFNTIVLLHNSVLNISGDVTVLVKNLFMVGKNAQLRILQGSSLNLYLKRTSYIKGKVNKINGDPSALKICVLGSNKKLEMHTNAEVYGLLQNPKGNIEIWGQTQFYGRMKGKNLYGNGGIHIDLDSSFGD